MPDTLSLLSSTKYLAKTWQADGEIKNYDKAFKYNLREVAVDGVRELSALLTTIEADHKTCLIRGKYADGSVPPEGVKGILRRKDHFADQPLHTVMIDIDKFTPPEGVGHYVTDPVPCIDAYIESHLPEEFWGVSYHWQLSGSAGHESKEGVLKAHVWFWLAQAASSASLWAWADGLGLAVDKALFDEIQIHYTAAPRFEKGVLDVVPVRSGFVEGILGDEAQVSIAPVGGAGGVRVVKDRSAIAAADDEDSVSAILKTLGSGVYKGRNRDGSVALVCPFADEHTGGLTETLRTDGMTTTVYWLAGTGGHSEGHFDCRHDSCRRRGDDAFLDKLGIREEVVTAGFDVVPVGEDDGVSTGSEDWLGKTLKQNDDGWTLAVIENVAFVLNRPESCGRDIRYDTFRDEIVYKKVGKMAVVAGGAGDNARGWSPFTDTDYTEMRIALANTGFLPINHEMMRQGVQLVAKKRMFDTAMEWLGGLPPWDGTPRVGKFLARYMGAEDNAYHGAVSQYIWSALAGRVLSPGCKADAAPIFIGEQYIGKSFAIAAMAPDHRMFAEVRLDDNEDNLSRKMRGKLIAEFAELRGLHTKELEGIKAFISRQYEEWVPKYLEFTTVYPRRLLFIGTSNKDEIFSDETGNRRWFPVKVTKGDCKAIEADRGQLWAEGRELFLVDGSVQRYYESANDMAQPTRDNFMLSDVWEPLVHGKLDMVDDEGVKWSDKEFIVLGEFISEIFGQGRKDIKPYDATRIGKILRKEGYYTTVRKIKDRSVRVWAKK